MSRCPRAPGCRFGRVMLEHCSPCRPPRVATTCANQNNTGITPHRKLLSVTLCAISHQLNRIGLSCSHSGRSRYGPSCLREVSVYSPGGCRCVCDFVPVVRVLGVHFLHHSYQQTSAYLPERVLMHCEVMTAPSGVANAAAAVVLAMTTSPRSCSITLAFDAERLTVKARR